MQPILTVNLTAGEFDTLDIPKEWVEGFLGGSSLAARILYDHLHSGLNALSPEARLLFMNGPLSGTGGPAVGRFVVCGRSPATGLWGESNCGGHWGADLRRAGFIGLLVTGQAPEPVYLWIHDGQAELRSAKHLWGKDTYQVQDELSHEIGVRPIHVASIGIAGENAIPFALILCDHGRVAGRTGMGAVMGSKRLKAIAVYGSGQVPVVHEDLFSKLRSEANRTLRNDPVSQVARELGTASVADYFDYLDEMPKKYFQRSKFMQPLKISGSYIAETILSGVSACHACVIACGRVVTLPGEPQRKGPEYETLVGFGPNLEINDPIVITRFGDWCDRYGMDSISLSNTIGLAMKLYEKGIISEKDTSGMAFKWGDVSVVERLIHLTARREGFGRYLAEGALSLGRRFHSEDEVVQVNGLEVPYHDPRGASGMALVYATSPRGACHNQSDYYFVEIGQADQSLGMVFHSPRGGAEKASNVVRHQNWRTVFNALVMCTFANVPPDKIVSLTNAATGLDLTLEDLLVIGERGWNLKRVINHRLGLSRQNDKLPQPLLRPYQDDPNGDDGFVPDLEAMLNEYYRVRGWDAETGYPKKEKLIELGLDWVIADLWKEAFEQENRQTETEDGKFGRF